MPFLLRLVSCVVDLSPRPNASDLNINPHTTLPNLVVVKLSTGAPVGEVDLYNSQGTIDALLDVEGWFQ